MKSLGKESNFIKYPHCVLCINQFFVYRRFVWNFFRLENEHLNNCGKFRAVRDISIAPIDFSDSAQIVRMMDEELGVTNRRKRKLLPTKKTTKEDKLQLVTDQNSYSLDLTE